MIAIFGLGNPGKKYEYTRHNAGFCTIDYIASKHGININKIGFNSLYGEGNIAGEKVVLVKPQTFMNLSGQAVYKAANFYKIPESQVLVLYDDISLQPGRLRIRLKGSAGGHNGIKSIIAGIGDEFPRIKIGVGERRGGEADLADFVLSQFSKQDKEAIGARFDDICAAAELIVKGQAAQAMNLYNG